MYKPNNSDKYSLFFDQLNVFCDVSDSFQTNHKAPADSPHCHSS